MTFQIQPRRAIYIYINNIRHAQQLKKFGQITYISRKMMFVGLYVNDENVEQLVEMSSIILSGHCIIWMNDWFFLLLRSNIQR